MEVGKCYVDGEGFYRVSSKSDDRTVLVEAVLTKDRSVSYYNGLQFNIRACQRRMVECSEDDFEQAKKKAKAAIDDLYEMNDKVFCRLWKIKRLEA